MRHQQMRPVTADLFADIAPPEHIDCAADFVALDADHATSAAHDICRLSLVRVRDGLASDVWQTVLDPEVPPEATRAALHGMSADDFAGAPTFADVAADVAAWCGDTPVVVPNARVHRGIQDAALPAGPGAFLDCWIDLSRVARMAWPGVVEATDVVALADLLGIPVEAGDAADRAHVVAITMLRACASSALDLGGWQDRLDAAERGVLPAVPDIRGCRMAFTGALSSMSRSAAAERARSIGVIVTSTVSALTDILVVGAREPVLGRRYGPSRKERAAQALADQGVRIDVYRETDFLAACSAIERELDHDESTR